MKNLVIIGAGGFGRELESYLLSIPEQNRDWKLKGFIDDNPDALFGKKTNCKIIGSIDNYNFLDEDLAVIGIVSIEVKHIIVTKLKSKKVNFFTFIAKEAFLGIGVIIGEGTVICPNTIIPNNAIIGDFVTININSTIGHDVIIGDYCAIMPSVNIGGEAKLGENIYIGSNANLAPRIEISDKVFIGVGSIVIKSITDVGTYFGNPARKMR
jgi:sugar O-acyltransferase (sialic acid O-acetyltransferase NeuD family)